MTSQQKADEWLAVWRGLRALGYTPVQRDRIIDMTVMRHQMERFDGAVKAIRQEYT